MLFRKYNSGANTAWCMYHDTSKVALEFKADKTKPAPFPAYYKNLYEVKNAVVADLDDIQFFAEYYRNQAAKNWQNNEDIANWTLVGGDPEFFLVDGRNRMVPSFKVLDQSPDEKTIYLKRYGDRFTRKKVNRPFNFGERDGWFYNDGYQLEFGYMPTACMSWSADAIHGLYSNIQDIAKEKNASLSSYTAKVIGPQTLRTYGEIPLGCRPCLNAYGEDTYIENPNPHVRFTGGHFHITLHDNTFYHNPLNGDIDTANLHRETFNQYFSLQSMGADWVNKYINPVVKCLDVMAGTLSLAIGGEYESPKRRQFKYGRAGDYRLNAFTLEYRVPASPVWFHPVSWHVMGMLLRRIVKPSFVSNYGGLVDLADEAREIINNTDYEAARKFITKYKIIDHYQRIVGHTYTKRIGVLAEKGLAGTYGNDIIKNWKVNSGWVSHSDAPDCNLGLASKLN